jgi:hypothetical protein
VVVFILAFCPGAVSWRRLSEPSSLADDGERCSRYAGFDQGGAHPREAKSRTCERHVLLGNACRGDSIMATEIQSINHTALGIIRLLVMSKLMSQKRAASAAGFAFAVRARD